jgi:1-acyl-sn-glycerol-3-phosphate acyltransferase
VDRVRLEAFVVKSLRQAARVSGFVALTPTMLAAWSAHDAVTRRDRSALRDRWFGAWCDAMLRVFGIRVITIGRAPNRGAKLVVSNHRGVADVLVLLRTFGGHMVSRADLAKWPLIGLAGRRLGTVFVDRSDIKSGAVTIRAMRNLLSEGETVTIFPEGTTFSGDEVRPFHAGGFVAAAGTRADIVPVGLAYSRDSQAAFGDETFVEHLGRMAGAPPSFVVVSIGEPLVLPAKSREAAEIARTAVAKEVGRAREEANRHDSKS